MKHKYNCPNCNKQITDHIGVDIYCDNCDITFISKYEKTDSGYKVWLEQDSHGDCRGMDGNNRAVLTRLEAVYYKTTAIPLYVKHKYWPQVKMWVGKVVSSNR